MSCLLPDIIGVGLVVRVVVGCGRAAVPIPRESGICIKPSVSPSDGNSHTVTFSPSLTRSCCVTAGCGGSGARGPAAPPGALYALYHMLVAP